MTKIQMPEPYWYEVISEDGLKVEMYKTDEDAVDAALDMGGIVEINHLITTDQAEAYKNACVREALEAAADVTSRYVGTDEIANTIRSLIKSRPDSGAH